MSKLAYFLLELFAVNLTGKCADTSGTACKLDPSIESLPFEDCGKEMGQLKGLLVHINFVHSFRFTTRCGERDNIQLHRCSLRDPDQWPS